MCGIHGLIDLDGNSQLQPDLLGRMGAVTMHRGPDDSGEYLAAGLALGMRRLSIIDLSGGHQPIANEDETVWVVCNGEIYNFQELRKHLEDRGHRFRTQSDTEILVHLYEELGTEFVKRLRGMFAIALWDANRSRLVLARDRLGKKPLYTARVGRRLYFASELKAILEVADLPRRVDLEALDEYLALGYVPAPRTMLEGVEKVRPGHLLMIENGNVRDSEYWDVCFDPDESVEETAWVEQVREKLLESVRLRLISDVPLGAFLSGGIDSSAIVALMAQLSNRPVKTYSIGFEGDDTYYNELPSASLVARMFSTDHHEIIVRPDVAELLPKLVWHLDEPIADSAFITTYLVSKLARDSVTVILSGVGGDELFGGYRRYLGDGLLYYYRLLPESARKRIPSWLSRLPQDRNSGWKNMARYAVAFAKTAELPAIDRYLSYVTVLSPEMRAALLRNRRNGSAPHERDGLSFLLSHYDRCAGADTLHQNMYLDMKTQLPDDLLLLTDKMSMAASIECRAAFMDHELVELAARIPSRFKVRNLTMKYLLKKVLEPLLPREILHRKKRGFGAPMGSWLRRDLAGLLRDTLSESRIKSRGYFEWSVVKELIRDHEEQRSDHTDHLLALLNFELWCRIYLDSRPAPAGLALSALAQEV